MLIFAALKKTESTVSQKSNPERIKTIYIIRHGQTDFNKRGIVQGSGVDTDLNETGLEQAKRFYVHYRDVPFKKIYTSSLKRTQQTVYPFLADGHSMEIIPELNEINWGIMEGAEPTPESHASFLETVEKWSRGELDVAVAHGETPLEMLERQKRGLSKIMSNAAEDIILICMHGRAMRSFLCLLTGTELKKMDEFEHGNVCLYILDQTRNSEYFHIRVRNSRSHLHELHS